MKKLAAAAVAIGMVGFAAVPAQAQIPTFDLENMISNGQQLVKLSEQITAMRDVETQLKGLSELAGVPIEDLLNGNIEQSFRTHMPSDFEDFLSMSGGGAPVANGYDARQYIQRVKDRYEPPVVEDLFTDPQSPRAQRYQRGIDLTINTLATSESAYEVADARNRTLEELGQRLANAETLKQSLDLQSRILLEKAYIENELVRLQAIQLQTLGDERAAIFERDAVEHSALPDD